MEGAAAAAWTALEAALDAKTTDCLDKKAEIAVLREEFAARETAYETKESLRFAQDAKKVKLGEASRDVDRA